VDEHGCEEREHGAEARLAEPGARVPGVDLAVGVAVPEEDVLLEGGLWWGLVC
jgi:hypothetical protein